MLIRLKGVKRVRSKGRIYFYHRATGGRINARPGTDEFLVEIKKLNDRTKVQGPSVGSLGALIATYRKSPEFAALATRTRRDYDRVCLWLKAVEDLPATRIDARMLYGMRDRAYKAHGRRFANYVVQVVRLIVQWATSRGLLTENLTRGVKTIKRPRGMARANRPWTDDEREAVLAAAKPDLRLTIALGMFAGLREGDAIRLPRSAFDGKTIATIAAKTGEPLWIPAHFRLRKIIGEIPGRKDNKVRAITLATNSRGQTWTEAGFRASFFKLVGKLKTAGKVGSGLTFHGLRHTVGKLIVDAGGDTRDVAAILGHRSDASAEHYSKEADRKKRASATIKRLERNERKKVENSGR